MTQAANKKSCNALNRAQGSIIVGDLEQMGLEALRDIWRTQVGPPPNLRSPELLRLMLAWRLQAQERGGLDADLRRALRRPMAKLASDPICGGTRLVREWSGVRHEVQALNEGGFIYNGARYRSLSQVARTITGSNWNGPRFFGLRKDAA